MHSRSVTQIKRKQRRLTRDQQPIYINPAICRNMLVKHPLLRFRNQLLADNIKLKQLTTQGVPQRSFT
jgi:hypothetical protein